MPDLRLGLSLVPNASNAAELRTVARRADELGFDVLGIQDHPYQRRFLDTWVLMATLLAETDRIRVFPDVSNLPLRGPAMIAKQAASLDVLSEGRFELGLGAGTFWEAIAAMGGPSRSPREALEALEEAIAIIRLAWSGEEAIRYDGRHYSVRGFKPGPQPAHPIEIWVGGYRPRMLRLIGRLADGWVPSMGYAPPEQIPSLARLVDEGAEAAGRDPGSIRRLYNVSGEITERLRGPLHGPAAHWIEELTRLVDELGFDTIVFWPERDPLRQIELFAADVAPGLRYSSASSMPS
jgi:alkanesulfonate monooxygenase SsuD/methylene tetrahydromethanopterin reductase-like flavin-dependent oxidoreductase (luciferase family)